MEIKRQVFAELDQACRPGAILATNTSSLSVTAIAAGTQHPGRVVGLHFFNPAPVMRLVEVVTTVLTDDAAATAGLGLPMGPLALLDLIGLDTSLSVMEVLRAEFGGPRYTPAPLLRRLVDAGRAGRKSGHGIYRYPAPERAPAATPAGSRNWPPAATPATITLIGSGVDPAGDLARAARAAGISVTRQIADPSDLVIMAASPAVPVLPAAIAAGRPADTIGLHLGGSLAGGAAGTRKVTGAPAASAGPGEAALAEAALAELVLTVLSSPAAAEAAEALAGVLGLRSVRSPDRPGFLAEALLYPQLADTVRMVQDGYAAAADVDAAMRLGCGYPRGPLELLDEIGAPVALSVLTAMHAASGDSSLAPPPLLAQHAAAGLRFRD